MSSEPQPALPPRGITLFTATCIVVANMIGTGVFTSLGYQVGPLPSGFAILALWAVGGLCALCGALAYGELAAALPRSGGEYHFLSRIYHPAAGFVAGWISVTVGFAAPVALAAMAFARYFEGAFPATYPAYFARAVSVGLVLLVTLIHLTGSRAGSRFQDGATLLKVLLLVALIVAGVLMAHPQPLTFLPVAGDGRLVTSAAFAGNLFWVMYAYSGWNASTYIVGEVREPTRNVPLSVLIGTGVVTALYVLLNFIMLRAAPMAALSGVNEVTKVAAAYIFGPLGAQIVSGLICAGLVATVSAMVLIGPRVAATMGEDWPPLAFLARQSRGGQPIAAILLQCAVTCSLLASLTFEAVNSFIGFTLTLCSFLTVLGVYVLRWRQPSLPRPLRAWGYPVTPFIFLAVTAWMMWVMLSRHRNECLASLSTVLAGLVVYFLCARPKPAAVPLV